MWVSKVSKMFNQNFYPRDRSESKNVLFCLVPIETNIISLNNHFVALLRLLVSTENKPKKKHEHRGLSKVQSKMDNLFLKELKKKDIDH